MAAVRIASVDRPRPEGLVPMRMSMFIRVSLLRLINRRTGRPLDYDVILTTFAILLSDLTMGVGSLPPSL